MTGLFPRRYSWRHTSNFWWFWQCVIGSVRRPTWRSTSVFSVMSYSSLTNCTHIIHRFGVFTLSMKWSCVVWFFSTGNWDRRCVGQTIPMSLLCTRIVFGLSAMFSFTHSSLDACRATPTVNFFSRHCCVHYSTITKGNPDDSQHLNDKNSNRPVNRWIHCGRISWSQNRNARGGMKPCLRVFWTMPSTKLSSNGKYSSVLILSKQILRLFSYFRSIILNIQLHSPHPSRANCTISKWLAMELSTVVVSAARQSNRSHSHGKRPSNWQLH